MGRRKELERDLIAALQQRDRALQEVERLQRDLDACLLARTPVRPSLWEQALARVDELVRAVVGL